MKKPRVLHLFNSLGAGGMERQTLQLVRLLTGTDRFEVHLAVQTPGGILTGEAEALAGHEVHAFPLARLYDLPALVQLARFAAHLRRLQVDLLHTHDFYTTTFGIAGAVMAGTPVRVASRRELDVFGAHQRRLEHWAYRRCDVVVANCERLRHELIREGLPARRTLTIRNGVDPCRVAPPPHGVRDGLRSELRLAPERRVVTMLANLYNRKKDFETLLRAAAIVSRSFPAAAFVLAGDGNAAERERLANLGRALGLADHLVLAGRCDRLGALLATSEIGVLSSHSEGLSNAVLEYMAAGLPVVATAVGGVAEAVAQGETGVLVPPGDAEALAEAIGGLLGDRDRARRMGEAGRRRTLQRFSPETMLTQTVSLYERLLASTGAQNPAEAR